MRLQRGRSRLDACNTLTLIRFWGDVQHEREEVLQKLCVVVRKMQTFAVLSGETEDRVNATGRGKSEIRSEVKRSEKRGGVLTLEPETRVLPIQMSWAATTAYLQTQKADVNFFHLIFVYDVNKTSVPPSTHTGAAASRHSGLPGCRIHCREVTPDRGYRREHQA